jgi:hypothetical protein
MFEIIKHMFMYRNIQHYLDVKLEHGALRIHECQHEYQVWEYDSGRFYQSGSYYSPVRKQHSEVRKYDKWPF